MSEAILLRLDPGKRNVSKNMRILMRSGIPRGEAFKHALDYSNQQSSRRWKKIHTGTQAEQKQR